MENKDREIRQLEIPVDLAREMLYMSRFNQELYGVLITHYTEDSEKCLTPKFGNFKGDVAFAHYLLAKGTEDSINGLDESRVNVLNALMEKIKNESNMFKLGFIPYHTHPGQATRDEIILRQDLGFEVSREEYDELSTNEFSHMDAENFLRNYRYYDDENYEELLISNNGIKRYAYNRSTQEVEEVGHIQIVEYGLSGHVEKTVEDYIWEIYEALPEDQRPGPIFLRRGLRNLEFE